MQALLEKLVWKDKDRADEAEQAWESLGRHLGFISTRPEKLYNTGPDNLWILSSDPHGAPSSSSRPAA
ncbi:hypothetical protein AB0N09_05500 [Streptomyces erythrochromogenes]|uniref:hypothetical protein n=1 Tax=Streptomyces erythrochromogenes TaxID=285574 RepID=UPI0034282A07